VLALASADVGLVGAFHVLGSLLGEKKAAGAAGEKSIDEVFEDVLSTPAVET
jgi:hypothetical protein